MAALAGADSPEGWKFLYSKDGMRMYEAKGADVPTYKAEGTIPVNMLELLAVIADVPRRKEWLPDVTVSRIVEGDIDSRVVIYERINLPAPVSDRDCLVESVIEKDFKRGVVTVRYKQVERKAIPPVEGFVRMPAVSGTMRYSFVNAAHTDVVYEASLDVGGALPEWLVKIAVERVPIHTLNALVKQVGRTRERYKSFVEKQRAKLHFKY